MTGHHPGNHPTGTRPLVAPELLPALDMMPPMTYNEETLPLIRDAILASRKLAPQLPPPLQSVSCEQRFIAGPAGAPEVRVLIYTPPDRTGMPRPAYLHIHGGGYIIGIPEINDQSNRGIAAQLNCIVVSVDYRLAPETRYPGAVEDCYAALLWLHNEAEQLGIDRSRIIVGGESAGGGHAAALALLARDRGGIPIRLQLLDSPMLDDRTGSSAEAHPYCGEFAWTAESNRFGWRALLGVEPGGVDVPAQAVPARVADLSGLPPAFILIGGLDLFLEESIEYARRLTRAGVSAELHVIPGAFHAFAAAGDASPLVRTSMLLRSDALRRGFSKPS